MSSEIAQAMEKCDPEGPLMINITKLYQTTDAQSFRAFGRIISGTLRKGADVKVLGEGYSPEDEEDMVKAVVEDIWISEARYESVQNVFSCFLTSRQVLYSSRGSRRRKSCSLRGCRCVNI